VRQSQTATESIMNALHEDSHLVWSDTMLLGERSWCSEGS